jgi:hypothetical protein
VLVVAGVAALVVASRPDGSNVALPGTGRQEGAIVVLTLLNVQIPTTPAVARTVGAQSWS